jgi:hypothetical protein
MISNQGVSGNSIPAKSKRKSQRFLMALVGMFVLGMLALITLVLLSDFPGPSQGSADKTDAPPEDVTRARP